MAHQDFYVKPESDVHPRQYELAAHGRLHAAHALHDYTLHYKTPDRMAILWVVGLLLESVDLAEPRTPHHHHSCPMNSFATHLAVHVSGQKDGHEGVHA